MAYSVFTQRADAFMNMATQVDGTAALRRFDVLYRNRLRGHYPAKTETIDALIGHLPNFMVVCAIRRSQNGMTWPEIYRHEIRKRLYSGMRQLADECAESIARSSVSRTTGALARERRRISALEKKNQWLQEERLELRDAYWRSPEWKEREFACFERDEWQCKECGFRGDLRSLRAHHLTDTHYVTGPLSDLVTLCVPDHNARHGRR